jgi:NADH-quinone oxidoreductase subunit G
VDPASAVPDAADPDQLDRARGLARAGDVVVVVGRPSMSEAGTLVAEAVQLLAASLPGARFLPALRRGNVHGALDMGLAPGLLPGRVSLESGRQWFEHAWGSVPEHRGRDTSAILAAAAAQPEDGSRVRSLVVLGSDPLGDFPDRGLARRALEGAEFVVTVATAPGAVIDHADVVLPAAEAHERPGTTTNIEGRVSRLGQKLVPPGQAWPDWMIAAELAVHLDADLGLDSVGAVWDEVERLAPAYRGITRSVLDASGADDGVLAPLSVSAVSIAGRGPVSRLDPIAVPGVESVERQGAPPRAGLAETPTAGIGDGGGPSNGAVADSPARPPVLAGPIELDVPHVVPNDGYSLRLVASRVLYDQGAAVASVPSLAGLVDTAPLRANPLDLDELGVPSGGSVRVRTAGSSTVQTVVADTSLARKVVAADFNVPLAEGTIADLIDAAAPVVELRLETP